MGRPLLAKLERHTLPLARLDYTRVDDAGQITSQIAAPTPGARFDVIPLDPAVGPLLLRAERLRQQLVGPDLVGRQQRAVRDALQPLVVREVGERPQLAGHRQDHLVAGRVAIGEVDQYQRARVGDAGARRLLDVGCR